MRCQRQWPIKSYGLIKLPFRVNERAKSLTEVHFSPSRHCHACVSKLLGLFSTRVRSLPTGYLESATGNANQIKLGINHSENINALENSHKRKQG